VPSQNSRESLKRLKFDFAEPDRDQAGAYRSRALASHRRPSIMPVAVRPPDHVLDRGATLPLPGEELVHSSSSTESSGSSEGP